MKDINVVYASENIIPENKSIFLAGPTPRTKHIPSWRSAALYYFSELEFDGQLFVPEPANGDFADLDYKEQVEWEEEYLNAAKCIMFWIPRDMKNMPALTTNIEFGVWCRSGKVVVGFPYNAHRIRYIDYYVEKLQIPKANDLIQTIKLAVTMASAE